MVNQLSIVGHLVLGDDPHLVGQACASCGAVYFGRRNGCGRCGGADLVDRRLSDWGRLRAFTVVHRAAPGIPVPFVPVVVDLDDGAVVKANLLDGRTEPDAIALGERVRLATFVARTAADGDEVVAYGFVGDR